MIYDKIKQNYSQKFKIATYNIRTMRTDDHLKELGAIKWDIILLCETRLNERERPL